MTTGAKITIPSSATGTYGGALEIRERDLVTSTQSSWDYSPRLTFHWGGRVVKGFGLRSDGQFAVDDTPISLAGHAHDRLVNVNAALPQDSCYTTELKGFASWIVDANSTSGGADGYILSNTWTNGTYVTQLYLDVDPTYKMAIRHRNSAGTWVAWKQILTEVNVSSYALTAAGGTLTGALNFKNGTWNNIGDDAAMGDCNVSGMVGIKSLNNNIPGFAFFNSGGTAVGQLKADANTLYWNGNTIWHAGNDGAGSGLDADLFDGVNSSGYASALQYPSTSTNNFSIKSGIYSTQGGTTDLPTNGVGNSIVHCNWDSNAANQLFLRYDSDYVAFRRKHGNVWQDWKQIAFTDSNVASATNADKLDNHHASEFPLLIGSNNFTGAGSFRAFSIRTSDTGGNN